MSWPDKSEFKAISGTLLWVWLLLVLRVCTEWNAEKVACKLFNGWLWRVWVNDRLGAWTLFDRDSFYWLSLFMWSGKKDRLREHYKEAESESKSKLCMCVLDWEKEREGLKWKIIEKAYYWKDKINGEKEYCGDSHSNSSNQCDCMLTWVSVWCGCDKTDIFRHCVALRDSARLCLKCHIYSLYKLFILCHCFT